jgi:hypothetical protein
MSLIPNFVTKITVTTPYNNMLKFRVLKISAYNKLNKQIISYDGSTKNNYIKFRIFKEQLLTSNYQMTPYQTNILKKQLSINFDIVNCSYDTLIYTLWYCGVENNLNKIYKYNYNQLTIFSNSLGVEINEVEKMLYKYNNKYKLTNKIK